MATPRSARKLGLWMSIALVVGNMIGSGIFLLPASLAPYGLNSIVGWILSASGAIALAVVLSRLSRAFPDGGGRVRAAEIGRPDVTVAADILRTAFAFPPPLVEWAAAVVGRPGWRHYLAYDGERPIATAAMFLSADAAWLGLAATADDARGRGAQTALIVRRIHDAAAAGCRHLVAETAEGTADTPRPSTRNLQRLGFTVAYLRPNYIWTREAPA